MITEAIMSCHSLEHMSFRKCGLSYTLFKEMLTPSNAVAALSRSQAEGSNVSECRIIEELVTKKGPESPKPLEALSFVTPRVLSFTLETSDEEGSSSPKSFSCALRLLVMKSRGI